MELQFKAAFTDSGSEIASRRLQQPGADGIGERRSSVCWKHLGLLALFPLILALFNDYWAYTSSQTGMIDPWLYVSYFLHLKAQLLAFPAAYYGDRLSSNLIGWALYHLFGPFLGNYILKLAVIYTAIFSLYATIAILFHRRTALLCAILISTQPYFLMAFGWDYVDGIGIAYYGLCLFLIVKAATVHNRWPYLLAAGACCTCLVTTQLLWVNLAWTLLLAYYLFNRSGVRHSFWTGLVLFSAGALAMSAAFCGVYHILTGHWFYLANSVRHATGSGTSGLSGARAVNTPVSQWIGIAHWLNHFTALCPAVLIGLFMRRTGRIGRLCITLFLLSYGTIWVWQILGFPFTKLLFYVDFIFPVYAIALAALFDPMLSRMRVQAFAALAASSLILGALLIFLAPVLGNLEPATIHFITFHHWAELFWLYQAPVITLIGMAVGVVVCTARLRPSTGAALLAAGLLVVGGLELSYQMKQGWFYGKSSYTNKEAFHAIIAADAWADTLKKDRRVLVWYDARADRESGVIGGLSSLYLWGWSLMNTALPSVGPEDRNRIAQEPDILVMGPDSGIVKRARNGLNEAGFAITRDREGTVRSGPVEIFLAMFRVRAKESIINNIIARDGLVEAPGAIKLDELLPTSRETSLSRGKGIHITTPRQQWAYAAYAPLPAETREQKKVWVRVSAAVNVGVAGFGVLNMSETAFCTRSSLGATGDDSDVLLEVSNPGECRKLIVENDTGGGERADMVISQIRLYVQPRLQ